MMYLLTYAMMHFLTSWRTLWCHDLLLDVITYILTSWSNFHSFLTSRRFCWHNFWHHDVLFILLTSLRTFLLLTYVASFWTLCHTFWHYNELLWCYAVFFDVTTYILTSWSMFWLHDVPFLQNDVVYLLLTWWRTLLHMMSWGAFHTFRRHYVFLLMSRSRQRSIHWLSPRGI